MPKLPHPRELEQHCAADVLGHYDEPDGGRTVDRAPEKDPLDEYCRRIGLLTPPEDLLGRARYIVALIDGGDPRHARTLAYDLAALFQQAV